MIETALAAPAPRSVATTTAPASEPPSIEIHIGGTTVRIRGAADAKTLAAVLKALTTARYSRVATTTIAATESPLDRLELTVVPPA